MARILLVEDETVIVMLLELWVADLGHDLVGPANDIASALAIIATSDIDAALVDVSLGGDQSYAIADALKAKNVPYAWGTGYSGNDIEARYRDVPILAKPYDADDFQKVIGGLLAT